MCSFWPYPFSNIHLRFSQVHSWLNRWFLSITVIFHYMNLSHILVQSHSETHLITFKFLFIPFWGWTRVSYIVHVRQTSNPWAVSWTYLQAFPIRNQVINICVWNFVWKQQPVQSLYLLVRTQRDVPLCFPWMAVNLISFPDLHFINNVHIFHVFFLSICDLGSYVFHHLLLFPSSTHVRNLL